MKYLVTGAHGKLGTELCPLIDCIGPSHSELDISSPTQIEKYVSRDDIDVIIHLAAITSRAAAERNKMLSYQINTIGTRNIAQAGAKYNKKVIYLSTEIVFPGSEGNYKETDNPNPRDWYAFTKYAGELEIQNATDNHLIIRTTFRPNPWGFPTAYTNVYTTGDYVDVIAKEIAMCLKINPSGVLHLGTPIKTWFELAKRRNPEVQPEEFPDPTFLQRDLNIEKWQKLKQKHGKLDTQEIS
jgi:dTDP-4-dehydrorhamnose reductase